MPLPGLPAGNLCAVCSSAAQLLKYVQLELQLVGLSSRWLLPRLGCSQSSQLGPAEQMGGFPSRGFPSGHWPLLRHSYSWTPVRQDVRPSYCSSFPSFSSSRMTLGLLGWVGLVSLEGWSVETTLQRPLAQRFCETRRWSSGLIWPLCWGPPTAVVARSADPTGPVISGAVRLDSRVTLLGEGAGSRGRGWEAVFLCTYNLS